MTRGAAPSTPLAHDGVSSETSNPLRVLWRLVLQESPGHPVVGHLKQLTGRSACCDQISGLGDFPDDENRAATNAADVLTDDRVAILGAHCGRATVRKDSHAAGGDDALLYAAAPHSTADADEAPMHVGDAETTWEARVDHRREDETISITVTRLASPSGS